MLQHVAKNLKEREFRRRERDLKGAEMKFKNLEANPSASVIVQSSNNQQQRAQHRSLHNDISRKAWFRKKGV